MRNINASAFWWHTPKSSLQCFSFTLFGTILLLHHCYHVTAPIIKIFSSFITAKVICYHDWVHLKPTSLVSITAINHVSASAPNAYRFSCCSPFRHLTFHLLLFTVIIIEIIKYEWTVFLIFIKPTWTIRRSIDTFANQKKGV